MCPGTRRSAIRVVARGQATTRLFIAIKDLAVAPARPGWCTLSPGLYLGSVRLHCVAGIESRRQLDFAKATAPIKQDGEQNKAFVKRRNAWRAQRKLQVT